MLLGDGRDSGFHVLFKLLVGYCECCSVEVLYELDGAHLAAVSQHKWKGQSCAE